jgi:hypothetical protein
VLIGRHSSPSLNALLDGNSLITQATPRQL